MYQLLGGWGESDHSSVLEYNVNTTQWVKVGELKAERGYHGISTVAV